MLFYLILDKLKLNKKEASRQTPRRALFKTQKGRMSSYKDEIITPGDRLSRFAHEICVGSYRNCPAVRIIPRQPGNFRGQVDFNWERNVLQTMLDDDSMTQTAQNDGAGGKPQFFTLVGTDEVFYNLGWEILEMCLEDVVRGGGYPAVMLNEANFKRITEGNYHLAEAMFRGYGEALAQAHVVNLTGEVAIMKFSITAFCDTGDDDQLVLTWGGSCLGLNHKDKVIDGSLIEPGMYLVGLLENGYRCNGGTFFTNLLMHSCPANISRSDAVKFWRNRFGGFIGRLVVPSKNYSNTVTRIHGWNQDGTVSQSLAKILGISHITGGGIWGKLGEIFPPGVGANLDTMPHPPQVLLEGQDMSMGTPFQMDDWTAYETTHGGVGMVLVCRDQEAVETIAREARKDGVSAVLIGRTTKSDCREIIIESRFREGRSLSSEEKKR